MNAMKTMFVRISKVSKMPQYADEVDNEEISKAAKALHDIGIEVYNTNGEFNNITDTLSQLNEKWDSLNDVQKSNISFQIAATRQSAKFKSMLEAWTGAMDLANEATNANGNALENQEKFEESYAGKMQRLQTEWQEFWLNMLNSDGFKGLIDALTKLIEFINELADKTSHLGVVITGLGLASLLSTTAKIGKQFLANVLATKAMGTAAKEAAADYGTLAVAKKAAANAGIGSAGTITATEYIKNGGRVAAGTGTAAMTSGMIGGGEAAAGAGAAAGGISAAAVLGWIAAIAAAIYGLYKAYDILTISVDEATEYMEKWDNTLKENETKLNKQKDLVKETKESYAKLAQGVNTINNTNIDLSDEEYKQFISLNNQLAEQFPELKAGIDDEGNAILNLGNNASIVASKLDELIDRNEKLNNITIAEALPETFKNKNVLLNNNKNAIEKYQLELDEYYSDLNDLSVILGSKIGNGIYKSSDIEISNLLVKSLEDAGLSNLMGGELDIAGYSDTIYDAKTDKNITEFYINAFKLDPSQKAELEKAILKNISPLEQSINNAIWQTELKLKNEQSKQDLNWQSFILDNFVPAMHSDVLYNGLNEEGQQLANALVSGLSFGMADAISKYDNPMEFIQQEILRGLEELQSQEFVGLNGKKLSVMDLFNGNLSNEELVNLYAQIQTYFTKNGINLKFTIGENSIQDQKNLNDNLVKIASKKQNLSDRGYNTSVAEATKGYKAQTNLNIKDLQRLREYTANFNNDQIEMWNNATEGTKSAEDAIKQYEKAITEAEKAQEKLADNPFTKGQMIDKLTDMSDGFDKLDEIYADIYNKGSFDFAKLSSKKFEDAFGNLGLNYEDFIETVSGHTDDLKYCQEAFNSLVDEYIRAEGILDNVTMANAEVTKSMLEMYGITNSQELVEQALINTEAKAIVSKYDLANATEADIQKLLEEISSADGVKQALIAAQAAEVLFANTDLGEAEKTSALSKIAEAAWGATAALEMQNGLARGLSWAEDTESAYKYIESKYSKIAKFKPDYGGGKSTKDEIDKANKSAEESKKIFDWIEKALQRQEEEISRIDKVVNATYKNWSKRNTSLLSEINEINKEIAMQQTAYQAYLRDAEAIPLSEEYKKLVREGAMRSEIITDKTLQKNIDEYEELYDKAIKAKDAIADLEAKIASLAKAKFDNVKSEFEGFTSEIEHFVNMIDKELSYVENMNKIAGKSFYRAKADQDAQKLEDLNKERTALLSALREAEARGIEEGSADWISMRNDIYSVDESIAELTYELEDLKKKMKEVAKLNFDDLKSQFENAISIITGQVDLTDTVVSMTQNAGYIASRSYYEALISGSKENVTGLRKELETLGKTLADAMNAGDIEKYDEQWYAMQQDITNVKKELVNAANATIEYANALRQIDWDVFDRGLSRLKLLVDESEFFQELMSWDDKLKDDNGDWTKKGLVKQGLIAQDYQDYMDQANAYGAEAEEIRKLLETDPKNTTLIDRYHELLGLQRDSILAALKEKKALTDLIKEGYDELLKRIKDLIDKYTEALDKAKDLMDYQNTIDEKTKTVGDITKQLTAYQGMGDTEEGRATVQKLQAQLKEAEKDLQQTEYDKYISDQKEILNDFYEELEEYLEDKYKETEVLFEEAVANINANGKLIDETLHEEADAVNYRMTDEFANIWDQYSSEDGIAAGTLNILTLTNEVTADIRAKMEDLPTEARLEEFFNSDDLRILQELTSVKYNTSGMISAIDSTNAALDQIKSNIVEFSGMLGQKIDYAGGQVTSAINSLEFSSGNTSYNAPGGSGGSSGGTGAPSGGGKTTTTKSSNTNRNYYVTGYSPYGGASYRQDDLTLAEAQKIEKDFEKLGGSIIIHHYAKGGLVGNNKNFLDSIAKLLGEDHMVAAKEGERILTEEQNKSFEKMVNANFTPLNDDERNKFSIDKMIEGISHISTPNVGNVNNVGNTTTVGDVNITLPNVTNKEEFVQWLKTDGQIERIIQSMSIGRLAGGNSFAKLKY